MQALRERNFWDPTLSNHFWLGLFTRYLAKRSPSAVAMCGPAGCDRVAVNTIKYSWTTCFWNNGYEEVDRQHGLFFSPTHIPHILYLWGHLQSAVCVTEVSDVQNLEQRIQNGSEVIRTNGGIFQRVRQSLRRRATSCLEAQGGNWEFSCSLPEAVTWTLRLVRSIFIQIFFLVLWRRFNFCRFRRAHFLPPCVRPSFETFPKSPYVLEIQNITTIRAVCRSKYSPYATTKFFQRQKFSEAILWKSFQLFRRFLIDVRSIAECWF